MKYTILLLISLSLFACNTAQKADLLIFNTHIYTVDSTFSEAEAVVIKDGKFLAIGKTADITAQYQAESTLDMQGKTLYPGFIDAHCHFYGYGKGLEEVNLFATQSFSEVLKRVKEFRAKNPTQTWIIGRAWDQNDWKNKAFPTKDSLDILFPDVPVYLTRIDGHAAIVNQKALDIAKLDKPIQMVGGSILTEKGKITGVLVDNAMDLVGKFLPKVTEADIERCLLLAEKNTLQVGLTSVADAGLSRSILEGIDKAQKAEKLHTRIYAMVSSDAENLKYYLQKGFVKTDKLNIRSFKIYADGALGSRGACLMHAYHDKPQETGFLLSTPAQLDSLIGVIAAKGFQINTHCIGDSANHTLLALYAKHLAGKTDARWRIEHAQVVAAADVAEFGKSHIIPSVQPTHATSDMYWAGERLGAERLKTAYAYKNLLKSAGILACGSDFPVEDINPLYGFHAAIARQDAKNYPEGGFQPENALTREEALKGMTIWAAYAQFEEKEKGSIEVGKMADFVVLDQDIMKVKAEVIRQTKVLATYIAGKKVF